MFACATCGVALSNWGARDTCEDRERSVRIRALDPMSEHRIRSVDCAYAKTLFHVLDPTYVARTVVVRSFHDTLIRRLKERYADIRRTIDREYVELAKWTGRFKMNTDKL